MMLVAVIEWTFANYQCGQVGREHEREMRSSLGVVVWGGERTTPEA